MRVADERRGSRPPSAPSFGKRGGTKNDGFQSRSSRTTPARRRRRRRLATFIPSGANRAGDRWAGTKSRRNTHTCALCSHRSAPSFGPKVKGQRQGLLGHAGRGRGGLVVCLFTQCHGRFGSSGGHVLSSGPTELNSLARVGPRPLRQPLRQPLRHLGTASCSGRPCQVAT